MSYRNNGFCVGVDFGTTFTSVAFAHSSSPDEVKLVQTWPNGSAGSISADQVPSVVYYTNPATRAKCWGYETPPAHLQPAPQPLQWSKLLLQMNDPAPRRAEGAWLNSMFRRLSVGCFGSEEMRPAYSSGRKFSPPTITPAHRTAGYLHDIGVTPVQVVSDFLRAVRELAQASIQQSYKFEWVEGSKINYILTIPAIWSDSAKNLMIQAAEAAGYGTHRVNFNLISEPEAAAAYTLKVIQPNNLNLGDTFIICDAGGGTVDLISYKITQLNPLRTEESVCGTGDLCGSVFLNERFEQYMRRLLGDDVIDEMKPRSKAEMMRTWEEEVKFRFGCDGKDDFLEVSVPGVPDDPDLNIEDGFHYMTVSAVQEIFDPIVDRIVRLVEQQVRGVQKQRERVAAILLVGGFGSSQYLQLKLAKARFKNSGKIPVLQPMNAHSAIARGALQRGLEGSMVHKRRSRRNYGYLHSIEFSESMTADLRSRKVWSSEYDSYGIDDKLMWYIKRNEIIAQTAVVTYPFFRMVKVPTHGPPNLRFNDLLLSCDLEYPPDYKFKNPSAVETVCTVHSDLTSVPTSMFGRQRNSDGNWYYKIHCDLTMTIVDEVIKFELLFQGTSYGVVTTKFDEK